MIAVESGAKRDDSADCDGVIAADAAMTAARSKDNIGTLAS